MQCHRATLALLRGSVGCRDGAWSRRGGSVSWFLGMEGEAGGPAAASSHLKQGGGHREGRARLLAAKA